MVDGESFGPYRIEALLGRGGMGEVYRAYDESQRRTVALKLLTPELAADESFRARFRRESEVAARLREAHVIPIHSYGEIAGRLYIDMRLVDGTDLASVLKGTGALGPARAVNIISQLARALDAAHADGLIHRDVKPSNVLVTDGDPSGDDDFVYLVDFGIARAAEDDGHGRTMTGIALGSLDYMPPERFTNSGVDRRADVYSLACLLYEMLTGRRPFQADGPALMYAHLNTDPPRPSEASSTVPSGLDEVVSRGMAKSPDARYPTAGELAAAARLALRESGDRAGSTSPAPGSWDTTRWITMSAPPASQPGPATPNSGSWPRQPPIRQPAPVPDTRRPAARPSRRPGWVTKGRAALIVAVGALLVGAATFVALNSTGPDPAADAISGSGPTAPTRTAQQTTDPQASTDTVAPDADVLVSLIPTDLQPCRQTPLPPGDSALASAVCSGTPVGSNPWNSSFTLYGDTIDLDSSYTQLMTSLGRAEIQSDDVYDCLPEVGYVYYLFDGPRFGYVTCFVDESDVAYVIWTDEVTRLWGAINADGGLATLPELFDWWVSYGGQSQ